MDKRYRWLLIGLAVTFVSAGVSLYLLMAGMSAPPRTSSAITATSIPASVPPPAAAGTNTGANMPAEEISAPLSPTAESTSAATPPPAESANDNAADHITGAAPFPTGGKPTGPFDLSWDFTRTPTAASGSIVVTNLASDAPVEVVITAHGAATLERPYLAQETIARAQSHAFPVTVGLGAGDASITVTVTHLLYGRRGRTIAIDFAAASTATTPIEDVSATTPITTPLSGTKIIRDASGEVIKLQESTPGK